MKWLVLALLQAVPARDLCLTRGTIDAGGAIEAAKVRAFAPGSDGNRAELKFVYRGPTVEEARLGSGLERRQLGLKLRAQDGCNLLYVMWRIEPKPGIVVSVKRNPGARTHAECGNRGYRNLKPRVSREAPTLVAGAAHTLSAAIEGRTLRVDADGVPVWEGELDDDALALAGPAGLRTDNARAEVELRVAGTVARACRASDED
jgi:hypothetical protein